MNLLNVINDYLSHLKLNYSIGTADCNKGHLMHFYKYCDNNSILLKDINYNIIVDYIIFLKKTCKNATINKRLGMIKRAFNHSKIIIPGYDKINKLKEDKTTFDLIKDNELYKIINYINGLSEYNNNLMYKLLIYLLIDTGARINEIMNIKIKNIDLINQEILLTTTKTKENRIVYFRSNTKDLITIIIKENKTEYLLYNSTKKRPINYDDVKYIFKKIKFDLNINKLHPHMFRHTMATKFIENDADLFSVMKILGHKNIKTTERYTHLRNSHVRNVYFNKYNYDEKNS